MSARAAVGRRVRAGVLLTCLLPVVACGGTSQTPPSGPGDTSSPAAQPPPATEATAAEITRPEQRHKTLEQALAALPDDDEVPQGWRPVEQPVTSSQGTRPAVCEDLYLVGPAEREWRGTSGATVASTQFTDPASPGSRLAVIVRSYASPVPYRLTDAAAAALPRCASFEVLTDDAPLSVSAEPFAVPDVGDRSFAVAVRSPGRVQQRLIITSGHTLVYVVVSDTTARPDQTLYDVADTVLDKLEK